jgi:hypothetical protein
MLRACVLQYGKNWDKCLSLAEFSYNNNYQTSIRMAPFEALYGRRCRTPLNWSQTGERKVFRPDLVSEAQEKIGIIQANLKTAQSRQKSYTDIRRSPLRFQVGDFVYLRVSPIRGIQRFGVKGKLAPRYIGPFEVLEVCGTIIRKKKQYGKLNPIFSITFPTSSKPTSELNYSIPLCSGISG